MRRLCPSHSRYSVFKGLESYSLLVHPQTEPMSDRPSVTNKRNATVLLDVIDGAGVNRYMVSL